MRASSSRSRPRSSRSAGQRQHPQAERAHRSRRARPAGGHLPRHPARPAALKSRSCCAARGTFSRAEDSTTATARTTPERRPPG
jgi:hypothetical protein